MTEHATGIPVIVCDAYNWNADEVAIAKHEPKVYYGMNHLPTCYVGNAKPCPSDKSLHGEPVGTHWWSGWPGAWCMKCGASDPVEECLANCECPCHADEHP